MEGFFHGQLATLQDWHAQLFRPIKLTEGHKKTAAPQNLRGGSRGFARHRGAGRDEKIRRGAERCRAPRDGRLKTATTRGDGGLHQRQARRLAATRAALRYSHNASLDNLLYYEDPGRHGHCEAAAERMVFPAVARKRLLNSRVSDGEEKQGEEIRRSKKLCVMSVGKALHGPANAGERSTVHLGNTKKSGFFGGLPVAASERRQTYSTVC